MFKENSQISNANKKMQKQIYRRMLRLKKPRQPSHDGTP